MDAGKWVRCVSGGAAVAWIECRKWSAMSKQMQTRVVNALVQCSDRRGGGCCGREEEKAREWEKLS